MPTERGEPKLPDSASSTSALILLPPAARSRPIGGPAHPPSDAAGGGGGSVSGAPPLEGRRRIAVGPVGHRQAVAWIEEGQGPPSLGRDRKGRECGPEIGKEIRRDLGLQGKILFRTWKPRGRDTVLCRASKQTECQQSTKGCL